MEDLRLHHEGHSKSWFVELRVSSEAQDLVVKSQSTWETAFHGTWWYSARTSSKVWRCFPCYLVCIIDFAQVWSVLDSGVFLESNDRDKGHDFWEPGAGLAKFHFRFATGTKELPNVYCQVYCSPNLSTARWYARPQILFGRELSARLQLPLHH